MSTGNQIDSLFCGELLFNDFDQADPKSLEDLRGKKLAVYGLGECSHWFFEVAMRQRSITPDIAIDRDAADKCWHGVPALNLADLPASGTEFSEFTAIVCIGNHNNACDAAKRLRNEGFTEIYHLAQFYEAQFPLDTIGYESTKRFQSKLGEIRQGFDLFHDKLSKELYLRVLQSAISGIPSILPSSDNHFQYFPADVELSRGYGSYVCCGSYDGENIRKAFEHGAAPGQMTCFEPDPTIYPLLQQCAQKYREIASHPIRCLPYAISNFSGSARFTSQGGLGSHLQGNGELLVDVIDLDSALLDEQPTLITMDIEGEELRALMGGEQTLRNCNPDLAISVYHTPEHLWEIPSFIHHLDLGYQFYLRNYTGYNAETVLYATAG